MQNFRAGCATVYNQPTKSRTLVNIAMQGNEALIILFKNVNDENKTEILNNISGWKAENFAYL